VSGSLHLKRQNRSCRPSLKHKTSRGNRQQSQIANEVSYVDL
jgi:hypothetical protein